MLNELNDMLFKVDTFPLCFYSSYSRLSLDVSVKSNLQIAIAMTFGGQKVSGRPQKGEQRYDNENQAHFSLSPGQCKCILDNLGGVMKNTYINPKATDPKYQNTFQIVNFGANNRPSYLSLNGKDWDDVSGKFKSLEVRINSSDGKKGSFVLTNNPQYYSYDLHTFGSFVKNIANEGLFELQTFKSKVKLLRQAIHEATNNPGNQRGGGNQQRSSGGYQNNSYNNQQPPPPQTNRPVPPTPPPPAPQAAPPQQSYSNNTIPDDDFNDMFDSPSSDIVDDDIPF